jgi:tetratricopeptide (TPR) repeat protein
MGRGVQVRGELGNLVAETIGVDTHECIVPCDFVASWRGACDACEVKESDNVSLAACALGDGALACAQPVGVNVVDDEQSPSKNLSRGTAKKTRRTPQRRAGQHPSRWRCASARSSPRRVRSRRGVSEVRGSAAQFTFRHALIRTTLYEELSATRQARLHRRVGESLEDLVQAKPGTRIEELAHHWLAATQAADPAKAIGYARQAGERALAGLAFEAAAHFERALAVVEPRDADVRRLRCDLLIALGDVQRRAGNPSYRETAATAVDVTRALGDGERLARAILGHARPGGFVANTNVVDERLLALYEEARAALGDADTLLRARVLGQLAVELIYSSERERRHALSREAVAIARRLGDPLGLAQALNHRLYAINDPFTLAERLDLTAELAALAARVGSSELALLAAFHRAAALLESGDIVGAEQSLAEVERLAGELRQPFYKWMARVGRAMLAVMRGEPDAEAKAVAAFELGMAAGQPDAAEAFGGQIYGVRYYEGRLGELLDILRANADSMPHLPVWRALLARAYCDTDQMAEARAQVDALRVGGFDYPPNWTWTGLVQALIEVVTDLQDRSAATELYEQMRPIAKQAQAVAANVHSQGSFGHFCGMLAACLGRWDDAERHFTDALAMNEHLGARPSIVLHPPRLGLDAPRPQRSRRRRARPRPHRRRPRRGRAARHGARARALRAADRADGERADRLKPTARFLEPVARDRLYAACLTGIRARSARSVRAPSAKWTAAHRFVSPMRHSE